MIVDVGRRPLARRVGLSLLVSFLIGIASSVSAAQSAWLWAKTDAAGARMQKDLADCAVEARSAKPPSDLQTELAVDQRTGLVGALILEAIVAQTAKRQAAHDCMHVRGYLRVRLTEAEAIARTAAGGETSAGGGRWADSVYASPAFASRLSAASIGLVPPLPAPVPLEPFSYGAVEIDAASLSLAPGASGAVGAGGVLLSGKASHRRTARLVHEARPSWWRGSDVKEGTVFQEIAFGPPGPNYGWLAGSYWCAPMTDRIMGMTNAIQFCVWTDGEGYNLINAAGQPWLEVDRNGHPDFMFTLDTEGLDFTLDVSPRDLLGPLDVSIVVKKVTAKGIVLSAVATQDGKRQIFWQDELRFDGQGQAVLPFWTHRLLLKRSGDGAAVSANWLGDGDGTGWPWVQAPDAFAWRS